MFSWLPLKKFQWKITNYLIKHWGNTLTSIIVVTFYIFFSYNTYINSISIYIQNKITMILNLSHDIIMLNYLRQTTSDVTYHIVYIVSLLDACKHTHTHTHFPTFHFNIFSTCFGMLHECDRKNFLLIIDCVMIVHIHPVFFYTKTHLIQWKLKIFLHHTFVSCYK